MYTSPSAPDRSAIAQVSLRTVLALAAVLGGCSIHPSGAAEPLTGEELYGSCDSCHGKHAEGKATLGAPAIAGLPQWYLEAEVMKFRQGQRGAHPDDVEGLRMRAMSRAMATPAEVKTVTTYISKLPRTTSPKSLIEGHAEVGKASFATCMACHGPHAEGNQAMNAPPLAGQADWYLARQLAKFRAGVRGTLPGDATGATMRPMSLTLANDQAVKDVVAYISTLALQ
jgi:cytochrome c553